MQGASSLNEQSLLQVDRANGEGLFQGVGKGYVALVDALLATAYPELSIRVTNMGIGGNTVRDLKARWQTDVIDLQPDWLTIMIGINDVWRQFDQPFIPESHVLLEEYEQTLEELVTATQQRLQAPGSCYYDAILFGA